MNQSTHIAVVIQEGRHQEVVARYPNNPAGHSRARKRWQKAYIAVQEQLERVPTMLRSVKVDLIYLPH